MLQLKDAQYIGGAGINEKDIDQDGVVLVEINEKYYRPCEIDLLLGDASKAEKELHI